MRWDLLVQRRAYAPAAFVWGLAEATLFFIIPDVLIGLVALFAWKRGLESTLWAAAGAVLGGVVVFSSPGAFELAFLRLPGISQAMIVSAAQGLADTGWWAVILAPAAGIPYKIYAAEAALQGYPLWQLIFITPVARLWRFVATALVAGLAGRALRGLAARRPAVVVALYGLSWLVQYVAYFRFVDQRYG